MSYADLMTLLFAVFVVLYGLKIEGKSDTVFTPVITAAIRESFLTTPDVIPDDEAFKPTDQKKQVFKFFRGNTPRQPIVRKYLKHENVVNVIEKGTQQVKAIVKLRAKRTPSFRRIQRRERVVTVKKGTKGFKIRLLGSYFFEKGSYKITKDAHPILRDIGNLLKEMGREIIVEGHTDNIPVSGEFTNWEFSSLRASHVLRFLIREARFKPKKGNVSGFAGTQPVGDNRTVDGRKLNRRIEIQVKYGN